MDSRRQISYHIPRSIVLVCLSLLFLLDVTQSFAQSPTGRRIVKGSTMRLAGKHTFTLTPGNRRGIEWQVDREETDEQGGAPSLTKAIATSRGVSASFDLNKVDGKETIYHIHVRGPHFSDTQKVQVFPPDRRSSFIFRSPGNPDVRTYIVVPSALNSSTRVLLVMHARHWAECR